MRRRSSLRSTSLGQGIRPRQEKLLLFLVEEVAGRPLKVRSRKAATDTPQDETRLAWRSVRTYVTAITDLYRTQKALGMNTHPSPREDNFAGEGSTRCMPLIFTTRAGKQNQHGRLETAGAYRNRNPLICILGGLSFYLLYRWDLGSEPFPDFSRRSSWYDIRLIKGNGTGRTAAFSYNSQREWVVKAFAYAGVTSQKKTHVGRSSGARTAELKGISEDQIRRAGRWNQEQMVGCYLNSLPRKFMRTMAGHPPQAGCFEIRRAGVTPPEVLLSMIWPELDRWRGRFGPGTEQENDLAAMAPFGTTRSSGIRPTPRSRTSYRTSSLKRSVQASLQS
ncbi:centromere DNA-binding protein complex CBF3 subunit [Hirsutella rhossiliensis]|uniref:Centromere DNA-binding protein complex CBF3 subunit n=1 Tax=Hirsutella rhossiliensis TaxID=111463 RepID=A0A9P8MSN2_9HYPO|nr:centromere DNA-binding protein complex CBF3 subunit [Hirsutella rhossiliensis]KAH0960495.1 centromere DNA-binding protein complex CBF3 subunit [Hirsutella rhossiliensis]